MVSTFHFFPAKSDVHTSWWQPPGRIMKSSSTPHASSFAAVGHPGVTRQMTEDDWAYFTSSDDHTPHENWNMDVVRVNREIGARCRHGYAACCHGVFQRCQPSWIRVGMITQQFQSFAHSLLVGVYPSGMRRVPTEY